MKPLDLRHLYELLLRHRKLALLTVGGTTLAAALLSTLWLHAFPLFTASAQVIMLPTDAEILFSNQEVGGPRAIPALAATHREYLQSRSVAEEVVDRLLAEHQIVPDSGAETRGGPLEVVRGAIGGLRGFLGRTYHYLNSGTFVEREPRDKAIGALMKGTDVRVVEGSFIFKVEVTLPNQELVAAAANELAKVYVKRAETDVAAASSDLQATYRAEIAAKELALAELRREEQELRRRFDLESSQEERRALTEAIESERSRLSDLMAQRQELEGTLEALRGQRDTTTSSNLLQQVEEQIALGEARLVGIGEAAQLRRRTLEDLETRLDTLVTTESELLDVQAAQRQLVNELDQLAQRQLQAGLLNLGTSRLRIIEPATRPDYPSSPKVVTNTFVVFVATALLTLFGLVLIDTFSNSITTEADLRRVAGRAAVGTLELTDSAAEGLGETSMMAHLRAAVTAANGAVELTGFCDDSVLRLAARRLAEGLTPEAGFVRISGDGDPAGVYRRTGDGLSRQELDRDLPIDLAIRVLGSVADRPVESAAPDAAASSLVCIVPLGTISEAELGAFLDACEAEGRRVLLFLTR